MENEVPGSFDDDDLRLANSQPAIHFYEWLGAIVLHHTTGYLSLVEKYEFATHPRKQQIVAQLLPNPVRELLRDRTHGRAQAPDLLMYAGDLSDWYFCEIKGPRDRLRDEQIRKFRLLADMTASQSGSSSSCLQAVRAERQFAKAGRQSTGFRRTRARGSRHVERDARPLKARPASRAAEPSRRRAGRQRSHPHRSPRTAPRAPPNSSP
jgi:VRR-NUC domain